MQHWWPAALRTATPKPVRRILRAVAALFAWLLVFAAAAALGTAVVAAAHGYRMVAVTSGSMRPAYQTGDAVLVKTAASTAVKPGDAVVFRNKESTMVLHRVVGTRWVLGKRHFMTKGDANPTTDPDLRPAGAVFGRAEYRVPHLGKQLHNLSLRPAKWVLVSIAGLTVIEQAVVLLRIKRRKGGVVVPVRVPCAFSRRRPRA